MPLFVLDFSWRPIVHFHHFSLSPSSAAFSDSFPSLPSLPPPFSSIRGDIKVNSYPELHIFHYEIKSIQMDFMFGLIYPFSLSTNHKLFHSPRERESYWDGLSIKAQACKKMRRVELCLSCPSLLSSLKLEVEMTRTKRVARAQGAQFHKHLGVSARDWPYDALCWKYRN